MNAGDSAAVNFPGNGLHGKVVRVERVIPEMDIAHPSCAERMVCEMVLISHPSLPAPVCIGPERLRQVEERSSQVPAARQGNLPL